MKRKLLTTTILLLAILLTISIVNNFSNAQIITASSFDSVTINGGDATTTSSHVTLSFTADTVNREETVEGVKVTNIPPAGPITWPSTWSDYSPTMDWILTSGTGIKWVGAQYLLSNGSTTPVFEDTIQVVTTPPSGSVTINGGDEYTNDRNVELTLSATDDSLVEEMRFSNDESHWSSWEPLANSKSWQLTKGDGTKTAYAQFKDDTGLTSTQSATDTIVLDTRNPHGTILINNGDASTTNYQVKLELTSSDDRSGVDKVRYTNADTWSSEQWEDAVGTKIWELEHASEGTKTVRYQVRDKAGNIFETSDSINFKFPNNPPTISPITGPTTGTRGVQYAWSATGSDPDGDTLTYEWYLDDIYMSGGSSLDHTFETDAAIGTHAIKVRVKDNEDAYSSNSTLTFTLTNTPPALSSISGPTTGTRGVQYAFTTSATDPEGDPVTCEWKVDGDTQITTGPTLEYIFPTEANYGEHIIQVRAHDSKGDYSDPQTHTFTLLDTTAPVTNHDYAGTWQIADFTINLTATDPNGVKETYYKINNGETKTVSADGQPQIITEAADNTLEFWSVDTRSNEETHKTLENIKLDKTKPTGSIPINNGATYTSSTIVTLSLTPQDETSGIFKIRLSNDGTWDNENWQDTAPTKQWQLTYGQGAKTVYYQIMDEAGLESITYSATITYTPTTASTPTPTPESTPTPTTSLGPTPAPTPATMPTPTTSASEPPSTGDFMELRDPQDLMFIILVVGILVIISSVAAYSYSKKQEENP
jgi:cell division septation protein DedD